MGVKLTRSKLAITFVGCLLAACGDGTTDEPLLPGDAVADLNTQRPKDRCVSQTTVNQLKVMVFDQARELSSNDPVRLNDLERQSTATIEMPLLNEHDEALDRTTCSGRLRIEVPVGARGVAGLDDLAADLTYSMQPAADGSGWVYQVDTFGRIATSIGYADLGQFYQSRSIEPAEAIPAAPTTPPEYARVGSTSFDCSLARTSVEQMICADPALGELDRRMASAYASRLRELPGSGAEQVAWINVRNNCADSECLYSVYKSRITELAK